MKISKGNSNKLSQFVSEHLPLLRSWEQLCFSFAVCPHPCGCHFSQHGIDMLNLTLSSIHRLDTTLLTSPCAWKTPLRIDTFPSHRPLREQEPSFLVLRKHPKTAPALSCPSLPKAIRSVGLSFRPWQLTPLSLHLLQEAE